MQQTVLFVPGFREDLTSRNYSLVLSTIEKRGYATRFIPIDWNRTVLPDWLAQLEENYATYDPAQTILAGFSFGAMAAFMAAAKRTPTQLWLFSLSSYFAEDMADTKRAWLRHIGKRRTAAFSAVHFADIAEKVTCKSLIFLGQQEAEKWPVMKKRSEGAAQLISDSQLIIVPKSGHDVTDPGYLEAIASAI